MNLLRKPAPPKAVDDPTTALAVTQVAELVGQVYEYAPAAERVALLEQLIRPLGPLSLLAVAQGVFAGIRLRGGWNEPHVRLEDAMRVQASDVTALADFSQWVAADTLDGLVQLISNSPVLAASSASVLLLATLTRRAKGRAAGRH
jgi:hypothetical protein